MLGIMFVNMQLLAALHQGDDVEGLSIMCSLENWRLRDSESSFRFPAAGTLSPLAVTFVTSYLLQHP